MFRAKTSSLKLIIGLGIATSCLAFPQSVRAQMPVHEPQADRQTLNEIKAIRDRLGGSVVRGLLDEGENSSGKLPLDESQLEAEFDDRLRYLARSSAGASHPADSRETTVQRKDAGSRDRSRRLRHVARDLEESAAQFEELGFFQNADCLRQMAARCWLQARDTQR